MGAVVGICATRRAASAMIRSPALSQMTRSRGLVTSWAGVTWCAWSTYNRAPLVRMTFASPRSSSANVLARIRRHLTGEVEAARIAQR